MDGAVRVIGDKQLLANLNAISAKAKTQILKPAMAKGAAVAKKRAKANARRQFTRRTGLLEKAIKSKGTRSKLGANAKVFIDAKIQGADSNGKKVWPVKYAHLMEMGTKHSQAKPFLLQSFKEEQSAVRAAIEAEARKQFKKLAVKGKTGVA